MRRQGGNQTLRLLARKKTNNPESAACPSSPRARRRSMRRPEGPGADPRGVRRMASPTSSRGSTRGTPESRPKSAAAANSAGNAASTDAREARPGRAGNERLRAISQTAGVRGATGAAVSARAAALSRPARTRRSARRCAAVTRARIPGAPQPVSWGRDLAPARPGADRHTRASRSASAVAESPEKMAAARTTYVSGACVAAPAGAGW